MKKTKAPPVPASKKELLRIINEEGIQSLDFTTKLDEGCIGFGFIVQTKRGHVFSFDQDVDFNIEIKPVEVLDFTTGNGRQVPVEFGRGWPDKPVWSRTWKRYENTDMPWHPSNK